MANGTMKWVLAASGKGRELPQKKIADACHIHASEYKLSSEALVVVWGILRGNLGHSIVDMGRTREITSVFPACPQPARHC